MKYKTEVIVKYKYDYCNSGTPTLGVLVKLYRKKSLFSSWEYIWEQWEEIGNKPMSEAVDRAIKNIKDYWSRHNQETAEYSRLCKTAFSLSRQWEE